MKVPYFDLPAQIRALRPELDAAIARTLDQGSFCLGPDVAAFERDFDLMGLQRHLKVAGIFARLTLRDGKPKYLADAPRFINYIRSTAARYRELSPLLRLIDEVEGTTPAVGMSFGRVE